MDVCVFVGYPKWTIGGLFYCPKEKKIIVSTSAKFLEEDYLMNHVPRSKLVLQELSKGMETQSSEKQNDKMQTQEVNFEIPLHFSSGINVNRLDVPQEQVPEIILPQSSWSYVEQTAQYDEVVDIPVDSMETHIPDNDVVQPQDHNGIVATDIVRSRSGKEIRQLVRYTLLGESYDRIPEEPTFEPINYDQALHDKDVDKWVAYMKSEMGSMYSNQVWDLVELPDGVKPSGCKWIYKKKRGVDGKVQILKARLVAKGFTKKEGIDYEETFSPVAMLKSIRILLSIAAHYDYEIWKMDVKTTSLKDILMSASI
ncbi:uncharacterized protein LOC142178232 [Nicotiana tabacum]|uniref:Uncharacterized protein LOC142178232 n=1 Tax=Nicotiana tabacum TaxID=4097 RepID=A0AC58U2F2_TOBAC